VSAYRPNRAIRGTYLGGAADARMMGRSRGRIAGRTRPEPRTGAE